MKANTAPCCRVRSAVPEIYFYIQKHYYVPFYFANEKIFYAEDRAKMNRELNLFVLWEIGFLARQIRHGSTMRYWLS